MMMKLNSSCFLLSAVLFASCQSIADAVARGATSDAGSYLRQEQPRQLMMDDDGGGNNGGNFQNADGNNLIERFQCRPFDKVNPNVWVSSQTDAACRTNSCAGGCCRLFEWAVCDEDNEFTGLQCICNENTSTPNPTIAPTKAPTPTPTTTPVPTDSPTVSPSAAPTGAPSAAPTPSPSAKPTKAPTGQPSPAPSPGPTTSPKPTTPKPTGEPSAAPTSSPTASPTTPLPTSSPSAAPTAGPTKAPVTSGPTQSPSASPSTSEPSESPSAAPTTSHPTAAPSASPSEMPTITPFTTEDKDVGGVLTRKSQCVNQPPNLAFLQTSSYEYSYEVYVQGGQGQDPQAIVDSALNDQIHDAVAKNFLKCTFAPNEDDLWIFESSPQEYDADTPCRGATFPGDLCFVVRAKDTIWVYDAPPSPNGGGRRRDLQASEAIVNYVTLINSYINNEMAAGTLIDSTEVDSVVYINDGSNPIVTKTPTATPSASPSSVAPVEGPDTSGFVAGAGQPINEKDGLPAAGIAALIIALLVVAIFVVFAVVRRKKHHDRELAYVAEADYLEKADLEIMHQVTSNMEDHLELDSNEDADHVRDMGMGTVRRTITYDEMEDDAFTSASPISKSPSKRSQRGPLHSQDELDKVVGNHRGHGRSGKNSPKKRAYLSGDTVNL